MTRGVCAAVAATVAVASCAPPSPESPPASEPIDLAVPAAPGAFAPGLLEAGDRLLVSWLEPLPGDGHRFVTASWDGTVWSPPSEIARGMDFFANWADVPGLGLGGDGSLYAHWLVKTAPAAYAYSVAVARSSDGGGSWQDLGWLHDDGTDTEHGFVSWTPEPDGARAVWLDGREMADDGPMMLRTARVGAEVEASSVVDDRVCECCPTDLAKTSRGPVAVYRDRSYEDVRDVARALVGGTADGVRVVHPDGWRIPGCPVNGPRIDAAGDRVAVAWFTAADSDPRVLAVFSQDGGETFAAPVRVDAGRPLGRVDLRFQRDGRALVSWMEAGEGERASIMLRRVDLDGTLEAPRELAVTGSTRSSGMPRLARIGGAGFAAWVETDGGLPVRLHVARLSAEP